MEAKIKPVIEHKDRLNQEIKVGQPVAFSWANMPGIRIGTVIKLTAKRVRIAYTYEAVENRRYIWNYLSTPERVLVLSDSLPAELTMLKLKGLLP